MRVLLALGLLAISIISFAQDSLLFKQARAHYFNNDPIKALETLDSDPTLKEGIHAVAYYMNAATALSAMNEYQKSNQYFDMAYQIVEDSSKKVGEKALSYLLNPMTTTYQGEIAEQLIIHLFKVQNCLALGDGQCASMELDKMESRISNHSGIYEGKNVYTGQTLFYLLSGIVAEYNGDKATALQMYLSAHNLYQSHSSMYFDTETPWQLKADIIRLSEGEDKMKYAAEFDIDTAFVNKKDNELLVFWQNGQSPLKKEQKLNLMITMTGGSVKAMDQGTGESFPVGMAAGLGAASKFLAGGTNVPLKFARYHASEPLYTSSVIGAVSMDAFQDFNAILKQSLLDRKTHDIGTMMGRHLGKSLLKNEAKKKIGGLINRVPGAALLGADKLANKAIDKAVDGTEKADWRQWDMLPASISYGRFYLPAGSQNLNVIMLTKEGKTKVETQTYDIQPGTNVVILRTFDAVETQDVLPGYVGYGAAMAGMAGLPTEGTVSSNVTISSISFTAPSVFPTVGQEAIFTEKAGKKIEEFEFSQVVGNPENMLSEGTVTLTFQREKKFVASAVRMVILLNGEDKTEVKNGDTNTIQFEANGSPVIVTMRNHIVKKEKNNPYNKRLRILLYPTRPNETFIIDNGKGTIHKQLMHKFLYDAD